MTRFLFILAIFISSHIFSQESPNDPNRGSQVPIEHAIGEKDLDSLKVAKSLEAVLLKQYEDSVNVAREIQSGMDYFLRNQREQRAKQKKQAMIYLGLGVFFLIVLIVGLRRKIKK